MGYKVGEVMTQNPYKISEDSSIVECSKALAESKVGAMLVVMDNKLKGIITAGDIIRKILAKQKDPINSSVKDIMETNLVTISPDEELDTAILILANHNIKHLPVVEGDVLVGLLTLKDIIKIQPQLIELVVDKIKVREEDRKPINKNIQSSGVCSICGEYSDVLYEHNGQYICQNCLLEEE